MSFLAVSCHEKTQGMYALDTTIWAFLCKTDVSTFTVTFYGLTEGFLLKRLAYTTRRATPAAQYACMHATPMSD